jgi:excinuclease ABC subunit B
MQLTIDETNKRREKQISYNKKNNITPTQINKKIDETLSRKAVASYQYNNAIKEVA